ncbi:MAG TPA: radical SAM family heme chaperone HemW [Acidobacteriaceae bacterium]|nr:radical SAM family heme chaperone HemW [Acidobacteriaceae bacterium]
MGSGGGIQVQPSMDPTTSHDSPASLGIYISVPFCRSKCTYCNFASGVYSAERYELYVEQVCSEIRAIRQRAAQWRAEIPERVDSVYFGGGTPSLLPPALLAELARALGQEFDLLKTAEITLECAPGQLPDSALQAAAEAGVNRLSFGVQSFVDREAAVIGRLHNRGIALEDLRRARAAGFERVNVDLIAGLPHQTEASWQESLDTLAAANPGHASVYMLEVDEDSRLGRELLGGGGRYHAASVPGEELTAALYEAGIARLEKDGLRQYEISNFARPGCESQHNLKYWRRQPYLGFGLDAHSFLQRADGGGLRLATVSSLEEYLAPGGSGPDRTDLMPAEELEEEWFLGLRLREGIDWNQLEEHFRARLGEEAEKSVLPALRPILDELEELELVSRTEGRIRLTMRGMMLSNEVFARFLGIASREPLAIEMVSS